ncbi:MAG: chromosome segregation protein SMC [Nitrosopumilus sp.]|nr:chromosome segregation protein SMC [Nitrosopumilus sp.]
MAHIKKVEIYGFKSFGSRNTQIALKPGLTAICGHNGSGKSNILNAIIFATGEKQPRMMSADSLRSLVHQGADRSKMARASVHFENSDRAIPFDADLVEVTREMDREGKSEYFLNRKKSTRQQVVDLLGLVHAGPDQMNVVHQGMVGQISRDSPEERRERIESLVGIKQFDEEKVAAKANLDEADKRFAVAVAEMNVKKDQIVDLGAERDQVLRKTLLEAEIKRYRAADAASKLGGVVASIRSKAAELGSAEKDLGRLRGEIAGMRGDISAHEKEEKRITAGIERYKEEDARIKGALSQASADYDAAGSAIKQARGEMSRLERRIPDLESEILSLEASSSDAEARAAAASESAGEALRRRDEAAAGARAADERQANMYAERDAARRAVAESDARLRGLESELSSARMERGSAGAEAQRLSRSADALAAKMSNEESVTREFSQLGGALESLAEKKRREAGAARSKIAKLHARKRKMQDFIGDLEEMRERSSTVASRYESKIKTVKGLMHEDYTVAMLMGDAENLGILDVAYKALSWDPGYERAVLAAASDWLKAVVVPDFATQAGIAEAVRRRGLAKIKIIPLEALESIRPSRPKMPGASGMLADHVGCRPGYEALRSFLLGDVVLAADRPSAQQMARAGYRAVTTAGEYFEADAGSSIVDVSSRISRITRIINMSGDIDGLFRSAAELKKFAARKKESSRRVDRSIESLNSRVDNAEKLAAQISGEIDGIRRLVAKSREKCASLPERIASLRREAEAALVRKEAAASLAESLGERARAERDLAARRDLERIMGEEAGTSAKKSEADRLHTGAAEEYNRLSGKLADARGEAGRIRSSLEDARKEITDARSRIADLGREAERLEAASAPALKRLEELRGQEQDLIKEGFSTQGLLDAQEKLAGLRRTERRASSEQARLDRRSDDLRREITAMREREAELRKIMGLYVPPDEPVRDVTGLISGLEAELGRIGMLNYNAPANYAAVADGYRSMSQRRNVLESERKKILGFIENIERKKKQTFVGAFDLIDAELRSIFSKVTGGEAWLELENEDDIFAGGVMYKTQFKGKAAMSSGMVSGGEQAVAAISFILALQKLNSAPFYIFDEIDAPLDAVYAKNVSKLLSERSRSSQFLMVSHKDLVIQQADLIYGVMSKRNASEVLRYADPRAAAKAKMTG